MERNKMLVQLKIALIERGLSQVEFARNSRLTATRLSRIIRGHVTPHARERVRIARTLQVSSWQLFPNMGRGRLRGRTSKENSPAKGLQE